jgi:hypothetical protein
MARPERGPRIYCGWTYLETHNVGHESNQLVDREDHILSSSRLPDLSVDREVKADVCDGTDLRLGNEGSIISIACPSFVVGSGSTHPMGVKVSNPLAVDQGSPFFLTASWMFRAVISIAKAIYQL